MTLRRGSVRVPRTDDDKVLLRYHVHAIDAVPRLAQRWQPLRRIGSHYAVSQIPRVAVIVVHGIADQRPGQTVREIVRLLCHGNEGPPRYLQGELHDVLVPVAKLEPGGSIASAGSAAQNPVSETKGADPARLRPGTPSGFYQVQQSTPAETPAAAKNPEDLGIALNDYLLGRLKLSEQEALYESTRVSLRRRIDSREVDVYEMYWADLSRLGTGGLRVHRFTNCSFISIRSQPTSSIRLRSATRAARHGGCCSDCMRGWRG